MGVGGSQENIHKKPVVLIVGGGYAGVQCAKLLDKSDQFFVILIDRKSYFLHNVAALRATVEENYAQKIIIPYDRLLTNGCVIQAEVISILTDSIQVHGYHDPIHFNYLVIATGSSYAFPGKVAEVASSKAISLYNNLQKKIKEAQQILIIGGGPVGIELAGEIVTDFPGKDITIVHNQPTLLQPKQFQDKLYARLHENLSKLHITVILNDGIQIPTNEDNPNMNYIEGRKTYVTEKNQRSITADLTFVCVGARVNNKSISNGPLQSKINPHTGRLMVNNYLQVDGYEKIFAIGDISDKEAKFAYIAADQANYVAKLIVLIEKQKPYPKPYQIHTNSLILLTLGRNGGVGQLPTSSGTLIGNIAVKCLKSKDIFTSRYRAALNYQSESDTETKTGYSHKLDSIQSILSVTEKDARDLLAGLSTRELAAGQDFI
ncbi:unnamed protein product [Adineta ricciae]|uniref:Ferroptosis suppressor protein 1 n=1 Tax=Adineta ricciae TaxID=249248 RepID=A0A815EHV6_ADIRI|nr:unnamed protein product [Adineta ricciae]CAF1337312.1 unnamed protein product [Adineta ricciae]